MLLQRAQRGMAGDTMRRAPTNVMIWTRVFQKSLDSLGERGSGCGGDLVFYGLFQRRPAWKAIFKRDRVLNVAQSGGVWGLGIRSVKPRASLCIAGFQL